MQRQMKSQMQHQESHWESRIKCIEKSMNIDEIVYDILAGSLTEQEHILPKEAMKYIKEGKSGKIFSSNTQLRTYTRFTAQLHEHIRQSDHCTFTCTHQVHVIAPPTWEKMDDKKSI